MDRWTRLTKIIGIEKDRYENSLSELSNNVLFLEYKFLKLCISVNLQWIIAAVSKKKFDKVSELYCTIFKAKDLSICSNCSHQPCFDGVSSRPLCFTPGWRYSGGCYCCNLRRLKNFCQDQITDIVVCSHASLVRSADIRLLCMRNLFRFRKIWTEIETSFGTFRSKRSWAGIHQQYEIEGKNSTFGDVDIWPSISLLFTNKKRDSVFRG